MNVVIARPSIWQKFIPHTMLHNASLLKYFIHIYKQYTAKQYINILKLKLVFKKTKIYLKQIFVNIIKNRSTSYIARLQNTSVMEICFEQFGKKYQTVLRPLFFFIKNCLRYISYFKHCHLFHR